MSDRYHECIKKAALTITNVGFSFRVKYDVSGGEDLDLDIFKE